MALHSADTHAPPEAVSTALNERRVEASGVLVSALVDQRRARYRLLREQGKGEEVIVLPDVSAPAEPVSSENQGGLDRASHTLCRLLMTSLVVPLCHLDQHFVPGSLKMSNSDETQPHAVPVDTTEALRMVRSEITFQPSILKHRFITRLSLTTNPGQGEANGGGGTPAPAGNSQAQVQVDGVAEALESSTLGIWLFPRLVCASAALLVRSAGQENVAEIKAARSECHTLLELLATMACQGDDVDDVRLCLTDALRASIDALAASGMPSFNARTAPPLRLLPPTRQAGEEARTVRFFAAPLPAGTQLRCGALARTGFPITRTWLPEDHAPFSPPLPSKQGTAFAHALLITSALLALRLCARFPAQLTDLGDIALQLVLNTWAVDDTASGALRQALPNPIVAARINLAAFALNNIAPPGAHVGVVHRLAIALSLALHNEDMVNTAHTESLFAYPTLPALLKALRTLRSALQKHPGVREGVQAAFGPLASTLVNEVASKAQVRNPNSLLDAAEKARGDALLLRRSCTFEALLSLLEASRGASLPLSLADERRLRTEVCAPPAIASQLEDEDFDMEGDNDRQGSVLLSSADRDALTDALNRLAVHNVLAKRKRLAQEEQARKRPGHAAVVVDTVPLAKERAEYYGAGAEDPASVLQFTKGPFEVGCLRRIAAEHCAKAGTLYKAQNRLLCSLCDVPSFEPTSSSHRLVKLLHVGQLAQNVRCSASKLGATAWIELAKVVAHTQPNSVIRQLAPNGELMQIVTLSMQAHERARFAHARLTAALVQAHCAADGSAAPEPLRQRLAPIFEFYRHGLMKSGGVSPRFAENALLALGLIGRIEREEVQEEVLLLLVHGLGLSAGLRSIAYLQITQLAAFHHKTVFQLLGPSLDVISVHVVTRMTTLPTLFEEVVKLTNQTPSKFLQTTLTWTLPHVVGLGNDRLLRSIATSVDQTVTTMCFAQSPAILKHFLLLEPRARQAGINKLLSIIRSGNSAIDVRMLFKSYKPQLLGHLIIHLGDEQQKQAALNGLHYFESMRVERVVLDGADDDVMDVTGRSAAISNFLKEDILEILAWLNEELAGAHGKTNMSRKAMTARSIGVLVELVGQNIAMVTPQVMATFNTTMQVPELMLPTLESWRSFITKLRFEDVKPYIGQTGAALLSAWPRFGAAEKAVSDELLRYIIFDNQREFAARLRHDFPSLDSIIDDVPDLAMTLRRIQGEHRDPEARLAHILARAGSENASVCLQGMQELRCFLDKENVYLTRITTGDAFDPMVGQIVSVLFTAVTRTGDGYADIRDLCFEALGMLGAVDPDRFELPTEEQSYIVLHNFEDREEAYDFCIHLIRHTLVGAFRASEDTRHQAALAYSIQELLKFCALTPAVLAPDAAKKSLKSQIRWTNLPSEVLDTIAPLLSSKYTAHLGEPTRRAKPIYANSKSYRDWIQTWGSELILGAQGDNARKVFEILRTVIRDHDLSIAQHILPHLVLNTIISGTPEQVREATLEIATILQDQVSPKSGMDADRRLLSAQTIFGILDHISLWIRHKNEELTRIHKQNRGRSREIPYDSALAAVRAFIANISDELMAKAALQCKAYARSLLNYEKRIRTLKLNGTPDTRLQTYYEDMHFIYANLDEPDGMEGISTKVIAPSLEHQIREHESTGRWTSAQSCWEVELQRKPNDPELHVGLLRCLRNLGHYDTMRTHIRGVLSMHPKWQALLAPFSVEGACILSDWDEVRRSLNNCDGARTLQQSTAHATARVVLAMLDRDHAVMHGAMRDARQLLGKPIVAAGKGSYARVYEAVTQLHMLRELELIQSHTSRSGVASPDEVCALEKRLLARLNATLPSFRTREPLLSLRRSAFATVPPEEKAFSGQVGEAWILTAKGARRAGHMQTAYSAVLQATQCNAPFAFVQRVKILALEDQKQNAIQEIQNAIPVVSASIREAIAKREAPLGRDTSTHDLKTVLGDPANTDLHEYLDSLGLGRRAFARANLSWARLVDATGRYEPNFCIERYRAATYLDPSLEKAVYCLGHYYDSKKDTPVANQMAEKWNVVRYYLRSAQYGTKFFYRTIPRVLTIWLDAGDDPELITFAKKTLSVGLEISERGEQFHKINREIRSALKRLKPYQWLAVFPQLVSRVVHKHPSVWSVLLEIVVLVIDNHPHQAMWSMIAGSQSKDAERKKRFGDIVFRVKTNSTSEGLKTGRIVEQSQQMAQELLVLCDFGVRDHQKQLSMPEQFPRLNKLADGNLILPLQSSITVNLPASGTFGADEHRPFPVDLPRIQAFDPTIDIMASLQKPRKIVIVGSDGKRYAFLCKPHDDLRKDARLMEFDSMINKLLQSNSESRRRRLYIRTYAVVTLNEECGLIEWVPNTIGLRHILAKHYQAIGVPLYTSEIKSDLERARANPRSAAQIFDDKVQAKYKPVFHEWFLAEFPEPTAWLRARLAYAHTLAVMSMVGYVLGLGDRHGENILFDASNGDTVHVDLNCLFEKGLTFDIPERVPFRLTKNLVDALGVTGVEGVFRRAAEITMRILRDNKDSLMSVLEAMIHDPLVEWGSDDRKHKKDRPDPRLKEARKSLDPIKQKLNGYIRKDFWDWTGPCTVNNAVDSLIRDATSSSLLGQMYVGWAAYL